MCNHRELIMKTNMKQILTEWRKYIKKDVRDSLVQAGEDAYGYMNCKLFVQTVTGVHKLDDLPSRPYTSEADLAVGDVLKWRAGAHWAIYLGNGDIMEVEEWGAESRIVPFKEVTNEMDHPDMVLSTNHLNIPGNQINR